MSKQRIFSELGGFFRELSALGGVDNDLDRLLEGLLAALQALSSLRVQPLGVVRMYAKSGRLISIARHGFQPAWLDPSAEILLEKVPQAFCPTAFAVSLEPPGRAIVLPLSVNGRRLGQTVVFIEPDWLPSPAEIDFLTDVGSVFSGLVNRCLTGEMLKIRELELEEARTQAIRRLGAAAEFRDHETGMHVMRMTNFAMAIAKKLGIDDDQRELLYITAPMHDVGKIGIGDDILLKPGKLTSDEFEIMKTHTEIGERLLHGSDPMIKTACDIAISHHENWDGSGYPRGLQGEEIPLLARICSVADVFDALTSKRTYKAPWPVDEAVAWTVGRGGGEIRSGRGGGLRLRAAGNHAHPRAV